jgi:hypothetical protein
MAVGHKVWAIAEGYIPPESTGTSRELTSHETICILNANAEAVEVEVSVYFADREPVGPYRFIVEGRRTRHLRFNDFDNPPVPKGTDFASVIVATLPIVVQHTRLDTRQPALAVMSTIAFPAR